MATQGAIGRRRGEAVARIERALETWVGGQPLVLPTFSRYGPDTLLALQLEAIADHLEAAAARQSSKKTAAQTASAKEGA